MPVALALSPHLDDAAFSAGGTLALLARNGWRVVVATVFTASVPDPRGFALACQLDKGLGPEVDYMALRRAEDEAACAALGAEARHLPFREAPHRGYGSAPALFRAPHADDAIVHGIAPALRTLLDELRPGLCLAPQGVGGHVDHLQTIRAIDRAGFDAPLLWWRDFPYEVRDLSPAEPLRERFATLPTVTVTLSPADRDAKRDACAAYASQIGFQFGGPAGLASRLAETAGREMLRSVRIPSGLLPLDRD